MSPTERTLAELRRLGYHAAVVERWIPFPKPGHRIDLFGGIDIVAVLAHPIVNVTMYGAKTADDDLEDGPRRIFCGVLGVQACAAASAADREAKLRGLVADPAGAMRAWLLAGNQLQVWSWSLKLCGERRKDGLLSRSKTWQVDRRRIGVEVT